MSKPSIDPEFAAILNSIGRWVRADEHRAVRFDFGPSRTDWHVDVLRIEVDFGVNRDKSEGEATESVLAIAEAAVQR